MLTAKRRRLKLARARAAREAADRAGGGRHGRDPMPQPSRLWRKLQKP